MLSIQNVTYTKCFLYEMLPRRNVTIRKCTLRNVTDPTGGCIKKKQEITYFLF